MPNCFAYLAIDSASGMPHKRLNHSTASAPMPNHQIVRIPLTCRADRDRSFRHLSPPPVRQRNAMKRCQSTGSRVHDLSAEFLQQDSIICGRSPVQVQRRVEHLQNSVFDLAE